MATIAGQPATAATTSEETANLALTAAFCAAWAKQPVDVARMVDTYFSEDCIVRVMDSTMIARGRRATIAMVSGWLESGRRFDLKILRSVALGPVVVQIRDDAVFSPGNAAHVDAIAAVFVLSGGRIREWSDYFIA